MQFWQLTGLFLTSFGRQKMTLFYTTYKVLTILTGFEGLVKRKQNLSETIVRGLAWPGRRVCVMQARSSEPGKRMTHAGKGFDTSNE